MLPRPEVQFFESTTQIEANLSSPETKKERQQRPKKQINHEEEVSEEVSEALSRVLLFSPIKNSRNKNLPSVPRFLPQAPIVTNADEDNSSKRRKTIT